MESQEREEELLAQIEQLRREKDEAVAALSAQLQIQANRTKFKEVIAEIKDRGDVKQVLSSLMSATAEGSKLKQEVLNVDATNEAIAYWSLVNQNKPCNLLLRLRVERQDEDEITVAVASIDEANEDLDVNCLPVPVPTASKTSTFEKFITPRLSRITTWQFVKFGKILMAREACNTFVPSVCPEGSKIGCSKLG
ncbi:hypothetical protein TrVE_jg1458 [Triparma verrucosa]|uniref:Uncharacterized protein n=1 Tax=Triparma verrucosa TaxID=1606542 RepID=A0A9W7B5F0_9STRA|nr:hypothetical protein TrVE_jg1458 [Triparma verrucosa]